MPTERRLAAIMFTDIVGSTIVTARSDAAGLALRDRHREVVRIQVESYHGRLIEAPGDESLATFESAVDAVHAALAIQHELKGDSDLQVRIGIHLGETTFRGDEVFGDGVNVAARIRPLAEPGGVCVSQAVYDLVSNQPHLELRSLGRRRLKNVLRRREVYAVSGEPGAAPVFEGKAALQVPDAPIRSIAVLPLENLGSPEQEYVADGVTDALIESLARVGAELRVISRTSVMQYKGTLKTAREIADELGVTYLIEGTAQRQDDRVLIRVQLIEAREDTHRWAQSYERDLRDFFSVQREIARAVAGEIEIALKPEREPMLAATRPVDPEALDLYLRARTLMGPNTLVGSWGPPAIELLERSVALDPDFTEGWVALAEAHINLRIFGYGAGSRGDLVTAREAAQRALELDAHLGAAHAVLGNVRLYYDWDFSGARTAFERAVQLGPGDPHALNGLAWCLTFVGLGKSPEAELLLERLLRVAPLDLFFRADRIRHFLFMREYERGIAEAERIREFDPEFVDGNIAYTYALLGRPEDAVPEMLAYMARGGAAFDRGREAFQRGSEEGGWEGGLRALTRLLIRLATEGAFGLKYLIALHSAIIGETEEAMTWLERAYEDRDPLLLFAKIDRRFDPLRSDPRFDDLLRRIGFPESSDAL